MATESVLKPGVSIKPVVHQTGVTEILSEIYGLKCISIKELNGYDDNNYHVIVDDTCENEYIQNVNKHGYILKVVNSLDSQKPEFFEAQNELLVHLGKKGICCPQPVKNKNGLYYSINKFASGNHLVRLLEYIEAHILHQISCTPDLFYQCGKYAAQLDNALKCFSHSAYQAYKSIWQLEAVPQLSQFLFAVTEDNRKKIIQEVLHVFSSKVLPICSTLESGMIHGDFNEQNILVEEKQGKWHVKGILDFGDSHIACYIFELAITMTYMMIQGKSLDVGRYVLAGYSSVRKLPPEELSLLKVCIAARLCQSLVLGAYSNLQDPNNSYVLITAKSGWTLLEELWTEPEDKLLERWNQTDNNSQ